MSGTRPAIGLTDGVGRLEAGSVTYLIPTANYSRMARNVVLVCLDTLRYDFLERHGGPLRREATQSFEECRTASTWSVPSHASMFTGRLPHEHGFHSATPRFESLEVEETFLADLPDHRRVGVSANPYASPVFGFDGLFDDFHHVPSSMPYPEGLSPSRFWHESTAEGVGRYLEYLRSCARHDHPLKSVANGVASQAEELFRTLPVAKPFDDGCERILRRVRRELERSAEPTFVFANIMDVHGPLANVRGYDQSLLSAEARRNAPELDALELNLEDAFDERAADLERYRELYAAAAEYVCQRVAAFCRSVDDDTAVIVTADHGEQLAVDGPPRRFGHVTPDVSEALLHVPLEIVNAAVDADTSEPISHLDLGALVTSVATGEPFEPRAPIAAEVAGLGVAHPPTDHDRFEFWNRTSRCAYRPEGKYVWDSLGSAALYDREDGAYVLEREGGPELVPEEARAAFSTPIDDVRSEPDSADVDGAVEAQLRDLGYL